MIKLFLDDYRCAPDRWETVRCYADFERFLETHNKEEIEEISLDYDLGEIRSGINAVEYIISHEYWVKKITIHSSHSNGTKMFGMLINAAPNGTDIVLCPRR